MAIFNSKLLVYQKVYPIVIPLTMILLTHSNKPLNLHMGIYFFHHHLHKNPPEGLSHPHEMNYGDLPSGYD